MPLDYSPYFPPGGKNAYSNLPVVPSTNSTSSTSSGVKYKTYTTSFDTATDTYSTSSLAEVRSYNIGCSGYRKILVSAAGNYQYAPCQTNQEYIDIMSQMPKGDMMRRYYVFDPTENVFDVTESINDTAYTGFDYKDQIFPRTLSNLIYANPQKIPILDKFQKVVFALIETVKEIKNYFNYTVPFNNRRVF
jgi:hypothetical protein